MTDCAVEEMTYDDVNRYTDNFSEDRFIGNFQWGKVYRGYIGKKEVVVKKWEDLDTYSYFEGENGERLKDELLLLRQPAVTAHHNLVKLIGYCDEKEERLAVIYDIKPRDSLYNLIPEDSFTWQQRMKVILGFAKALEFMHTSNPPELPYLIRNISAEHIIVDMDYNAKLVDFGMITGGVLPDRRTKTRSTHFGCCGYHDFDPEAPGYWSEKVDVYAFGTVLLMLISKRVIAEAVNEDYDSPMFSQWAAYRYIPYESRTGKFTLVHESLQGSECFCCADGDKVEKLAMRCTDMFVSDRPTMKEVAKELSEFSVLQGKKRKLFSR